VKNYSRGIMGRAMGGKINVEVGRRHDQRRQSRGDAMGEVFYRVCRALCLSWEEGGIMK